MGETHWDKPDDITKEVRLSCSVVPWEKLTRSTEKRMVGCSNLFSDVHMLYIVLSCTKFINEQSCTIAVPALFDFYRD